MKGDKHKVAMVAGISVIGAQRERVRCKKSEECFNFEHLTGFAGGSQHTQRPETYNPGGAFQRFPLLWQGGRQVEQIMNRARAVTVIAVNTSVLKWVSIA